MDAQNSVEIVLLLLLPVMGLMLLAERWRLPYPILLVIGGAVLGFVPGLPHLRLDPEIVLLFIVPPLLYLAASTTSLHELQSRARPIGLLSIGLVFFTTGLVALAAHRVLPSFTWPAAFALGAIVSPPDAVAAAAIFERLGVPRRIVSILQGESLVNDASALVVYRFAVAAAVTGSFSFPAASLDFAKLVVGGVLFGGAVGYVSAWARHHVSETPINITLSLLTPFAAYLPAEKIGASSVLAVVTAGLVVGWYAPAYVDSKSRLPANAIWRMIDYLLNGIVFILIGLQLPDILAHLSFYSSYSLFLYGAGLSLLVIVIRILWVFPLQYLPETLFLRNGHVPWQYPTIVAWAGMRGVMSLAIALGLPIGFPGRDLIVFLTFCVIFATLVFQGLTLPFPVRWLGLGDDGLDAKEEALALLRASEAVLAAIEQRANTDDRTFAEDLAELREVYQRQHDEALRLNAALIDPLPPSISGPLVRSPRKRQNLRREMLQTERGAFLTMRRDGQIHDNVLHRLEHELDLEEQRTRHR